MSDGSERTKSKYEQKSEFPTLIISELLNLFSCVGVKNFLPLFIMIRTLTNKLRQFLFLFQFYPDISQNITYM